MGEIFFKEMHFVTGMKILRYTNTETSVKTCQLKFMTSASTHLAVLTMATLLTDRTVKLASETEYVRWAFSDESTSVAVT